MALKFVSAQKPSDYAYRLFEVQQELAILHKKVRALEVEQKQLTSWLLKYAKGNSFGFDGPRYQMWVKITNHQRMILDQDKVRKLLKSKTPYTESTWITVKVDYQYTT